MTDRLRRALGQQEDIAYLVVFRVLFGLLGTGSALRFVLNGWVEALYLSRPTPLPWFPWIPEPSAEALYGLFAIQAFTGVGIAIGWRYRWNLSLWLLSFVSVELLEQTLYLNHYVLFTLLGVILWWCPAVRVYSADARAGRTDGVPLVPRWCRFLLQAQLGTVYLWAGLCKLNPDWILRGEPLTTWLQARREFPIIGQLLALPETGLLMSWGGAAFDLIIVALLVFRPTRVAGVLFVIVFHVATGALFQIGVFPWLMVCSVPVFFKPHWPRALLTLPRMPSQTGQITRTGLFAASMACLLMVLIPARSYVLPGDVNWNEHGFRFSWRVLLIEKTGTAQLRVVEPATGKRWVEQLDSWLNPIQAAQVRTSPPLLRDFAQVVAHDYAQRGHQVEIYADAWCKLNGHPTRRLIDPTVDLLAPLPQDWVLP